MRSPRTMAPSSVVSGATTMNSSPPTRPTVSAVSILEPVSPFADALLELEIKSAQFVKELPVLALKSNGTGGVAKDVLKFFRSPGLEEVAVDFAAVDRLDGIFELRIARHEEA